MNEVDVEVAVETVTVPNGSTIGYGTGTRTDTGEVVRFTGDHRPMRELGRALADGESPIARVPAYALGL